MLERERERYLGSHAVHSATLYDIWRENCGEEEAGARWRVIQQEPLVPHDYRRLRSRPVKWHHKPRRTSGFRKICSFSDNEKLWHLLARDLIVAQHNPRSHVGDWKARGRDAQMTEIIQAITSGKQAVVCADICRAFASVNIGAVYNLPFLPEALTRRAIDYRSHRFERRERSAYALAVALAALQDLEVSPSGLMEGSPASNAIFSVLLDDLPDHLGKCIQAFVYCDNIILLAPNMLQAQQAEQALAAYLTSHRAGPFSIISCVQSVCEPFEHLGYELQWQNEVEVRLSTHNWLRLMKMVDSGELSGALEWLGTSFRSCTPHSRLLHEQIIESERT